MGERFACAVIVAVVPFAASFGLAIAVQEQPILAVVQGVLAYFIVATVLSLLVTVGTDEALQARKERLLRALPAAEAAWRQEKEEARRLREEEREARREAAEREWEAVPVEPVRRGRPEAPVVHVHIHGPQRSAGAAAVLELIPGLFLHTFGIGHMYVGNVGLGLFLMFGYWLFVTINVLLCFTCVWIPVALILGPAVWFILVIVSPLLASASAT